MTTISQERKRAWLMMQRASSLGLDYDPLTGRLALKQPGKKPFRRSAWRKALDTCLSQRSNATITGGEQLHAEIKTAR